MGHIFSYNAHWYWRHLATSFLGMNLIDSVLCISVDATSQELFWAYFCSLKHSFKNFSKILLKLKIYDATICSSLKEGVRRIWIPMMKELTMNMSPS